MPLARVTVPYQAIPRGLLDVVKTYPAAAARTLEQVSRILSGI
jgi:hypothetical protein